MLLANLAESINSFAVHLGGRQVCLRDLDTFLAVVNAPNQRATVPVLKSLSLQGHNGFTNTLARLTDRYELCEYEWRRTGQGARWLRLTEKGRALAAHLMTIEYGDGIRPAYLDESSADASFADESFLAPKSGDR